MKNTIKKQLLAVLLACLSGCGLYASSHREAPLIADDPLADNTDLYAFRTPNDPSTVTIIACYVPFQLPQGGPNYYFFGQGVRYEVHVDNDPATPADDIVFRFTFRNVFEDPTTFFSVRLGKVNNRTLYTMERSLDGGRTFETVISDGVMPPPNIGKRSIEGAAGLNTTYEALVRQSTRTLADGTKVFCGASDDPFFVDLGGVFDLGDMPRQNTRPVDGVACKNISSIVLQVPISVLRRKSAAATPANILDPNYVIGVWASASRQKVRTLGRYGAVNNTGDWVQVSRIGMPLTNEAVIPVGDKDYWNALTPYQELTDTRLDKYFYNPELALYMDDALFGSAVPAFAPLRVQRKSLGRFDFGNGKDGLFPLKGNAALAGTALDDAVFGTLLLPGAGQPRSVDLWPIFHTGVPNLPPYQLATGKNGNPLAIGKPFIHNFLPNGGDMLRLNMAVPVTPRNSPQFSTLGIINAAVRGLTEAPYNTNTNIEFIPNMDGFPNGRRLEDDVTRIELQAVAGVALAAIGLWYDDFIPGQTASPVTPQLVRVLGYQTGVGANDVPFRTDFPYVALPHAGDANCVKNTPTAQPEGGFSGLQMAEVRSQASTAVLEAGTYPNPFVQAATVRYQLKNEAEVYMDVFDQQGRLLQTLVNDRVQTGTHEVQVDGADWPAGLYFVKLTTNGQTQVLKMLKKR